MPITDPDMIRTVAQKSRELDEILDAMDAEQPPPAAPKGMIENAVRAMQNRLAGAEPANALTARQLAESMMNTPQQLDLFGDSMLASQQAIRRSLSANEAMRRVVSTAGYSVNDTVPKTLEERARDLLIGQPGAQAEDGKTEDIGELMQELLALGVEDLRVLQSNNAWTIECRVCVANQPRRVHADPKAPGFIGKVEPHFKTFMRMEVSSAESYRDGLRELLLATQLYISTKGVMTKGS